MMYEKPKMDFVEWDLCDVITLSGEQEGDGDVYEDSWAN